MFNFQLDNSTFQEYLWIRNESHNDMSSPITPLLYLDETGNFRIYMSGWKPTKFVYRDDSMFLQGKPFPESVRDIGSLDKKVTEDQAIEALKAATKYYTPKK